EPSGIHMRCQVRQPCPESLTDSLERSNGNAVAVQCRRGHVMTADAFGRPVAQRQQVLRLGAVGGAFTGLTYERVSAGVLLPAAAPTATTHSAIGNEPRVAELPGDTEPTAIEGPVKD